MELIESRMKVFYDDSKLQLSSLDAKTYHVSAQFERFGVIIELKISEEVLQLKTLLSELVEDIKSLKNHQYML